MRVDGSRAGRASAGTGNGDLASGGGGGRHGTGGDGSSVCMLLVVGRAATGDSVPLPGLRSLGCDGNAGISSSSCAVKTDRTSGLGLHGRKMLSPKG